LLNFLVSRSAEGLRAWGDTVAGGRPAAHRTRHLTRGLEVQLRENDLVRGTPLLLMNGSRKGGTRYRPEEREETQREEEKSKGGLLRIPGRPGLRREPTESRTRENAVKDGTLKVTTEKI